MSVDRQTDLEVDLDDNRAVATVVEKRTIEVDDLFNDTGEPAALGRPRRLERVRPRDRRRRAAVLLSVNTRFDEDEWISKIRCGERAVRDAVEKHIEDPKAGRAGRFVRRCSPP